MERKERFEMKPALNLYKRPLHSSQSGTYETFEAKAQDHYTMKYILLYKLAIFKWLFLSLLYPYMFFIQRVCISLRYVWALAYSSGLPQWNYWTVFTFCFFLLVTWTCLYLKYTYFDIPIYFSYVPQSLHNLCMRFSSALKYWWYFAIFAISVAVWSHIF